MARDRRFRGVLIDHAARRGFERRRQSTGGSRDLVVVQPPEAVRGMPRDRRVKEEEQLLLAFRQFAHRWQQHGDIAFLLPAHNRRGMLAGGSEMRAIRGTVDFNETFCGAADGADGLSQRGTLAPSLALIADRTGHAPASHTSPHVGNV